MELEEKQLELITKKTTESVFEVLRKNGFEIKEKKTVFQKTEQLLYLIPQLKEAIDHNKERIKDLKKYGISKGGSAVHVVPQTTPLREDVSDKIKREIENLQQRNYIINSQIKWVNGILNTIRSDKFFEIIELKYYNGKTHEEIAEYFNCDESTVRRNKNRLINRIKTLLFPSDSVSELGC